MLVQRLLYNFFLWLYLLAARVLSFKNVKAKQWVDGRKQIFEKLQQAFSTNNQPVIWVHCASLGEFEQGKPIIEQLYFQYPHYKILITFFSPSGYEVSKNYPYAHYIFYLPIDGKRNAQKFYKIVKPSLVVFVKYEFWFYYLQQAKLQSIPLILVSGIFRKSQIFFKWYGGLHRQMLNCFSYFFVQDNSSLQLLQQLRYNNAEIAGDTRFDRVFAIAATSFSHSIIEQFIDVRLVVVAGSTWIDDDEALDHFANTHSDVAFIIAPHVVDEERIADCKKLYRNSVTLSALENGEKNVTANVLIIDSIGILSKLYRYAQVCYIGGAFGADGVHNVLEAAVYNKPVVFGPEYEKFIEAAELLQANGATSVDDALELEEELESLLNNSNYYSQKSSACSAYMANKGGASKMVIHYIHEKRLLTN